MPRRPTAADWLEEADVRFLERLERGPAAVERGPLEDALEDAWIPEPRPVP